MSKATRLISLVLLSACLSLAACGKKEAPQESGAASQEQQKPAQKPTQ
jgi:predicted small lipoprotein YifL